MNRASTVAATAPANISIGVVHGTSGIVSAYALTRSIMRKVTPAPTTAARTRARMRVGWTPCGESDMGRSQIDGGSGSYP